MDHSYQSGIRMVCFDLRYGIRFYIGDYHGAIMQSATQENAIRGIRLRVNNTRRKKNKMTIEKVENVFRKYNPQLTVIKVTKVVYLYFVCAVYDVSNGMQEMNSLYKYNIITGQICHFNPLEHQLLSLVGIKWGRVLYNI